MKNFLLLALIMTTYIQAEARNHHKTNVRVRASSVAVVAKPQPAVATESVATQPPASEFVIKPDELLGTGRLVLFTESQAVNLDRILRLPQPLSAAQIEEFKSALREVTSRAYCEKSVEVYSEDIREQAPAGASTPAVQLGIAPCLEFADRFVSSDPSNFAQVDHTDIADLITKTAASIKFMLVTGGSLF